MFEEKLNGTPVPENIPDLELRLKTLERRVAIQQDEIFALRSCIRNHVHIPNGQILVPLEI